MPCDAAYSDPRRSILLQGLAVALPFHGLLLTACRFAAFCCAGDDGGAAAVRVRYGRLIRQLKDNWRLGVLLAPLVQLPQAASLGVEEASGAAAAAGAEPGATAGSGAVMEGEGGVGPAPLSEQQLQAALGVVQELLAAAAAFKLEDAWQWKSMLSGKEVRAGRAAACFCVHTCVESCVHGQVRHS